MVHPAIPPQAERPNLLNGLVAKRAEIAGQIKANEQERKRLANELRTLDATILLFDPGVDLSAVTSKPVPPPLAAAKGAITPVVYEALRTAETPLTSLDLAHIVLRSRGLPTDDPGLLQLIRRRVTACLLAKKRLGAVRSTGTHGPFNNWEIVR